MVPLKLRLLNRVGWIRTDVPLLQKRKRVRIRPADVIIENIRVALIVDVRPSEKLDRSTDDAGDEQDKQDEGEQHHGAREKLALGDVDDFDDDEYYGERADCYAVGHDPEWVLVVCFSNCTSVDRKIVER